MVRQIIKQPNRNWAIFDLETGTFVTCDCTADEVASEMLMQAGREAQEDAKRQIAAIEEGHDPYGSAALTWGEALAEHRRHVPEDAGSFGTESYRQ